MAGGGHSFVPKEIFLACRMVSQFHVVDIPTGWYKMTTRRGKQFNSMVFNDADTLQGGKRRDDIFLSEEDALELGVVAGDGLDCEVNGNFSGYAMRSINRGALQTYW